VRLRSALLPALALATGGCAMRTDVVRLERQIATQQREMARADSARAASLAAVARLVQGLLDSLAVQQDALTRLRGDLRVELFNVQQQLVAIQELTGQSQQRLSELRSQIDQRSGQIAAPPPEPPAAQPAPGGAPPSAPGAAAPVPVGTTPSVAAPGALTPPGTPANPVTPEPTADQLMELALQQLRRGSPGTARVAFAEFLRRFRAHPRAADAEFFTGEAWAAEQRADSAAAAYRRVVDRYPASPRAASALYKLAVRALGAERRDEARTLFNRVVTAYPSSEEAALARDQLRSLTPGR
jgi:tol-pal system protein YbgF